jgi:hypothetical protein
MRICTSSHYYEQTGAWQVEGELCGGQTEDVAQLVRINSAFVKTLLHSEYGRMNLPNVMEFPVTKCIYIYCTYIYLYAVYYYSLSLYALSTLKYF